MNETKFEKNWVAIVGVFVLFSAFPLLTLVGFLWKVILFLETGFWDVKLNTPNLMFFLLAVGIAVFCFWVFVTSLSIRFTDEGVWQRNLLRWRFFEWKNLTYAEQVQYTITIYKGQEKMHLFLAFYTDIDKVMAFIQKRISSNSIY